MNDIDRAQVGFFTARLLEEAIDAPPRARNTDPETSHEAADSTSSKVAASQGEVILILSHYGPLADHEIVAKHERLFVPPTYSPQRLRSARSELVEAGRVEFADEYRLTPSGRRARVWRLS